MSLKRPSLKKNVIFNYIGQIYSNFVGIFVLPMFLLHMGAESYGLVAFFTLIQAWLQLFDVGMSPTLSREISRLKNKIGSYWKLVTVVNTLELTFIIISIFVGLSLSLASEFISNEWLNAETLRPDIISESISIMALISCLRLVTSLNKSGINAFEEQVWMNLADIITNTFRFPCALIIIIISKGDVLTFFYYQLVIVMVESIVIRVKLRKLLPKVFEKQVKVYSLKELKRLAPFALSLAYTSGVWVLLTQLDKLLLSKFLTLSEYGYFTLIGLISSAIIMLSTPVTKALLPRITAMLSDGSEQEMLLMYRNATRLVSCFIFPIGLIISIYPEAVVYTWTGDKDAAVWIAPILPLYTLGSTILGIMTFQYLLQNAHGQLKYHVLWNTFSLIINIPLIIFCAINYGAIGVGYVWFGYRLFSLIFWSAFVHSKFAPGIHKLWLLHDVLIPFLVALVTVFVIKFNMPIVIGSNRLELAMILISLSLLTVTTTCIISLGNHGEKIIREKFKKFKYVK